MIWTPFRLFFSCFILFFLLDNALAADFKFSVPPPPPGATGAMRSAIDQAFDAAEHSYRKEMAKYKKEWEISKLMKKVENDAKNAPTKEEGKAIWQKGFAKVEALKNESIDNVEITESELRKYLLGIEIPEKTLASRFESIALEPERIFTTTLSRSLRSIFEAALAANKYDEARAAILWNKAIIARAYMEEAPSSLDEYETIVAREVAGSFELGLLHTVMGNFNKAARYLQISLPKNHNQTQLEKLCNKAIQEEKERREESNKLLELIDNFTKTTEKELKNKQGIAESNNQYLSTLKNESFQEILAPAPNGVNGEMKNAVYKSLIDAERQYRIYLANRKIDIQVHDLQEEARNMEQRASTKEEKDKVWEKASADIKSLNMSRNEHPEISETDFQEYLNGLFMTPEAIQINLSQVIGQKKAFARKFALDSLQGIFEDALANARYADAKAACAWQFDIAHGIDTRVNTDPANEYAFCQSEVIPYHKNFGRLYTAIGDWPKAVYHFGINLRLSLEDGVEEALCKAAAEAAKRKGSHCSSIALALMPFLQKAFDEKDWDLAEKIGLWQIALEEQAGKKEVFNMSAFELVSHTDNAISRYYYNLGLALKEKGNIFKAKEYFKKSLAPHFSSKSLINNKSKASAALILAEIEADENDPVNAHIHSNGAWSFMIKQPKVTILDCHHALRLMVSSSQALGEYGRALQEAETLIDFLTKFDCQGTILMAEALGDLASVQNNLGDTRDALEHAQTLLKLYSQQKGIGNESPDILEQAIKITPDSSALLKAKLYLTLGEAKSQLKQEAAASYKSALKFAQESLKGKTDDLAEANLIYGDLLLRHGQLENAIPALFEAFHQYYMRQASPDAACCAYLLLKAYAALGQNRGAIFWGKKCINLIQQMRADIRSVSVENQQSFINARQKVYHDVIDLLQQEKRILEAEHIYSLLKKEELHQFSPQETLFKQSGQATPMIGIEENLETLLLDTISTFHGVRSAVNMAEQWDDKVEYLKADANKPHYLTLSGLVSFEKDGSPVYLTPKNQALMREMLKSQNAATGFERHYPEQLEISPYVLANLRERLKKEHEILYGFLKAMPLTLAAQNWEDNQEYLAYAARNLDADTALLHAVATEDNLLLWLTGNNGKTLKIHKVPVSRNELRRHVIELRDLITQKELDPRPKCKELYDILIAPVAGELQELKPKTLLFSLDNVLRYIPPAILHNGQHWLLEDYAIGHFLEASRDSLAQKTGGFHIGAMGLSEQRGDFPPLPGVERELESIVRNADNPEGIIPGEMYLNDTFTEQSLSSALQDKISFLHIATHFKLDPKSARESFLLMGDGAKLPLSKLKEKQFDFGNLRHISLSACETGLRLDSSGSEIESLGSLMQEKGSQSVLATLWPISDAATSILMPLFYKNLKEGKSRAEALRQAQLTLIKENWEDKLPQSRGDKYPRLRRRDLPGRSHPFYWGAFILMGNWH